MQSDCPTSPRRRSTWSWQRGACVGVLGLSLGAAFSTAAAGASLPAPVSAQIPSQSSANSSTNSSVNLSEGKQAQLGCPEPALSRFVYHRIASGETLASIAQQYNLLPTTLMGLNPVLQSGGLPVGTDISIPPYNGIRVNVAAGSTWRDLAQQYGVRADLLFEANGCEAVPTVVFIPGATWSPVPMATRTGTERTADPIDRYPLPDVASILLAYGWQVNPQTSQVEFHPGVRLAVASETPVFAAGAGTVAFAGEQGSYGKLVVVNHAQGLQTRYAQLQSISVQVGQQVESGTPLGTVGTSTVGTSTTGTYLHFEVRSNSPLGWVAQDPGAYLQDLRLGRQTR